MPIGRKCIQCHVIHCWLSCFALQNFLKMQDIETLKQKGLIIRVGPDNGGCWYVKNK